MAQNFVVSTTHYPTSRALRAFPWEMHATIQFYSVILYHLRGVTALKMAICSGNDGLYGGLGGTFTFVYSFSSAAHDVLTAEKCDNSFGTKWTIGIEVSRTVIYAGIDSLVALDTNSVIR